MHIIRFIVQILTSFMPSTRLYPLKSALWRLAGFDVHPTARLVSGVKILTQGAVHIGARSFIGHETLLLNGAANITIGDDVAISARVILAGGSHEITPDAPCVAGQGTARDITIHNGAWVGIGAIILPGITIGEKAIVAAGAVVTKNVDAHSIVAGNPARLLRNMASEKAG
jgi:maltose O-acetyltransferase